MCFKAELECCEILPPRQPNRILSCVYLCFGYLRDLGSLKPYQDSRYMKPNNAIGCFSHYYFRGDLKRAFNPLVCSHSIPETTTHNESTIGLSDVGMFLPTLQKIGYPESFNCCFSNSFKNVPMGNVIRPWMN